MLDVKYDENRAVIDVREKIKNGEHPRGEILNFIQEADQGTIVEIHLPFLAQPLIGALESLGLNVTVDELGPGHVKFTTVKL